MASQQQLPSTWAKPATVFLGLLLSTGCAGPTETVEAEAHWLSKCSEARPCADGLSCHCGVCTSRCKRDDDCIGNESGAVCSPGELTRFADECNSSELTSAVCVAEDDLVAAGTTLDAGVDASAVTTADSGMDSDGIDGGSGEVVPDATGTGKPPPGGAPVLFSDKIDLLFVIDNSASMADKQILLKEALPTLIQRLVNPSCIDDMGNLSAPPPANGNCPNGSAREFKPLQDINLAVITSSLGDFGAADGICTPDGTLAKSERNDGANLLGLLPRGVAVLAGKPDVTSGFLHWSASSDGDTFGTTFANLVESAREFGCGYEATLEAWYRFLIDPTPYTKIVRNDCGVGAINQCIGPEVDANGFIIPDQNVLNQRQAFLRPDSLVGIVMLTDENDCSFRTTGQSWRLTQLVDPYSARPNDFTAQYRSSAACETNPEDACCFSCGLVGANQVPNGCSPDSCLVGGAAAAYPAWGSNAADEPPSPDHPNLRCFEQKRRFGLDYLFPVQRYVNALKQVQICPSTPDLSVSDGCAPQINPLYDDLSTSDAAEKKPPRPSSLVFFAGIVGVPWQDLAVDPDPNAVLKYRKSVDPENPSEGVNWNWLLGDTPMALQPTPGDILLHEQVEPRDTAAANPAPGGNAAPPTATRNANRVNGHEWDTSSDYADLQYACIFPIEPKDCPANLPDDVTLQNKNCDCTVYGNDEDKNPLCQDAQNNYGLTQYYAKGYPGIRQLQVLYGYQANSIVASICPKVTDDNDSPEYGYNPAIAAIVHRLKEGLEPAQ